MCVQQAELQGILLRARVDRWFEGRRGMVEEGRNLLREWKVSVNEHGIPFDEGDVGEDVWKEDGVVCLTGAVMLAKEKMPDGCAKAMLVELGACSEEVVPKRGFMQKVWLAAFMLHLDLQGFVRKGRGVAKAALPTAKLQAGVAVWKQYHPRATAGELKGLGGTPPYAVLWNALKRCVLRECGLVVSKRAVDRVPLG